MGAFDVDIQDNYSEHRLDLDNSLYCCLLLVRPGVSPRRVFYSRPGTQRPKLQKNWDDEGVWTKQCPGKVKATRSIVRRFSAPVIAEKVLSARIE